MTTSLTENLKARIADQGPIPLDAFMGEAIATYYRRPHVFGQQGDFVTAPEISQVFGELVGLWFAMVWLSQGQPASFRLVECGPGRGTLMSDALRATQTVPGFHQALDIHLVETSPTLRQTQSEALAEFTPTWHEDIQTVPDGPLYVIANEFLDALPTQQYQFDGEQWHERVITLENEKLAFALGGAATPPADLTAGLAAPEADTLLEHSPDTDAFVTDLSQRIAKQGGAALLFDYGYTEPAYGDTVQAMSAHNYVDVLSTAGDADLTAHVNFHRVSEMAQSHGIQVHGPVTQGEWLPRMGLEARLHSLYQHAAPEQRKALLSGARRLIDPQAMGRLFKVIALTHPDLPQPEGFAV